MTTIRQTQYHTTMTQIHHRNTHTMDINVQQFAIQTLTQQDNMKQDNLLVVTTCYLSTVSWSIFTGERNAKLSRRPVQGNTLRYHEDTQHADSLPQHFNFMATKKICITCSQIIKQPNIWRHSPTSTNMVGLSTRVTMKFAKITQKEKCESGE